MDTLPKEILEQIVARLPARALCSLACASRAFRRLADARRGLAVQCGLGSDAWKWVLIPHVARRIERLQYRRVFPPETFSAFAGLRVLDVQFVTISAGLLRSLPPRLESLVVHRLWVSCGRECNLAAVLGLPRLRLLDLTFRGECLARVFAQPPPHSLVERLRLRGARRFEAVCLPAGLRSLTLHARVVSLPQTLPAGLRHLELMAASWPSGLRLPGGLESISLSSPDGTVSPLPSLAPATQSLRRVFVDSPLLVARVADLQILTTVPTVTIQTEALPVVDDPLATEISLSGLLARWIVTRR